VQLRQDGKGLVAFFAFDGDGSRDGFAVDLDMAVADGVVDFAQLDESQ